ncbi:hypothetical protein SASPL_156479 [Salvia splendens]|uniref:Nodulin homeobox N-terminal domain-containing protein n=1 Tax=Salvia splendens TaxID=180675 RepID=A0A8X8VWS7_SALSN|nr:hypothetical protein SASPL_156479 [Salvia splendens]
MVKQLCDAGTVVCWELCRGQIFNFLACCIRDVLVEINRVVLKVVVYVTDIVIGIYTLECTYLLCGILLLHSMFHLTSRVPKIEQVIGSQTVLSIIILLDDLLHLCEAESVSYLEEVASKTSTQDVAKSVGLKVLALLKNV